MKRRLQGVERLESRNLLAIWGNPWPEPERLSVSFAPDGTQIHGISSRLDAELDGLGRPNWQNTSLLALQTWAKYANLNFFVTEDLATPFGATTSAQGLSQAGDIRFGSIPLTRSELAVASPYDLFNDWSGEIVLNANHSFTIGTGADYDLFTTLLQESGHALSIGPSTDPTSVMYGSYTGRKFDLAPVDRAAIQTLYGQRRPDRFEGSSGNNSPSSASSLTFVYDVDQFRDVDPELGVSPFIAKAELSTMQDVDVYRFDLPADLHDFQVVLRTNQISLLTAKVSVLDSSQRVLAVTRTTDPLSGDIELFVPDAIGGQRYFVKVEGYGSNAFEIGAYKLAVGKEALEALFPSETTYINDDIGDDDDGVDTLVDLAPKTTEVGPLWDYSYRASISFSTDQDFYRIVAPTNVTATTSLTVASWSLDPASFQPRVQVYASAAFSEPLPAEVVTNDEGTFAVQIRDLQPGGVYFLKVAAADPLGSEKQGNYLIAADFRSTPLTLPQLAAGWVDEEFSQDIYGVYVSRWQTHHFRFSLAAPPGTTASIAARVTIYNGRRQMVESFIVRVGEDITRALFLMPDAYTVRIVAATEDGSRLPRLAYTISGIALTDPVGPQRIPPDGIYAPGANWQYYYYRGRYLTWVSPLDPFGSPWR